MQEDNSLVVNQTPRRTLPVTPNVIIANQNPSSLTQYTGRTEFMRNKFRREQENKLMLSSEDTRHADKSREVGSNDEKINDQNERTTSQICRFYKKGTCKHGLKGRGCPYTHPKACPKLLKFGNKAPKGCNQGAKCPNFHPRMCSSSIRRGECFNETCTFTHVKGTKRKPTQNNSNDRQGPVDFLKILDNFRKEMILLINNNLQARIHQPLSQTFTPRYPNQVTPQQSMIQRMPIHNQNVLLHPTGHAAMEPPTVPRNPYRH